MAPSNDLDFWLGGGDDLIDLAPVSLEDRAQRAARRRDRSPSLKAAAARY